MRIFANLHRDGITAVSEQALRAIRKELSPGLWSVVVYGNGNVRIFRFCPEFPPVGVMFNVGPYNRTAEPHLIEDDLIFEMQELTKRIAA